MAVLVNINYEGLFNHWRVRKTRIMFAREYIGFFSHARGDEYFGYCTDGALH